MLVIISLSAANTATHSCTGLHKDMGHKGSSLSRACVCARTQYDTVDTGGRRTQIEAYDFIVIKTVKNTVQLG